MLTRWHYQLLLHALNHKYFWSVLYGKYLYRYFPKTCNDYFNSFTKQPRTFYKQFEPSQLQKKFYAYMLRWLFFTALCKIKCPSFKWSLALANGQPLLLQKITYEKHMTSNIRSYLYKNICICSDGYSSAINNNDAKKSKIYYTTISWEPSNISRRIRVTSSAKLIAALYFALPYNRAVMNYRFGTQSSGVMYMANGMPSTSFFHTVQPAQLALVAP